jgi:phosphoserine aminotransferase
MASFLMKKYNFNSGPSILPQEVLEQAAKAIIDFNGIGLSILEVGHRTAWFVEVIEEAKALVKELLQLDEQYDVLFLHGGATTQFMQIPMNLLDDAETAVYFDHGVWGSKAIKEASLFGNVHVAASSKDHKYTYINKDYQIPTNATYVHLTSNNTVEGTQWHAFPETSVPLVADMSSDIFSRVLDYKQFAVIYAGAQKNMGAAGVNMIVIRKDVLGKVKRKIPAIMDYRNHIEAGSLLNTPPVFAIYVAMLTLRWIKKEGGLAEMERRANEKSNLLYNTIDALQLFNCPIAKQDRSKMNAVFFIEDDALQNQFLEECKASGMVGVKGYRTVGGIRVSMYNALPLASVQAFCDLATSFNNAHQ